MSAAALMKNSSALAALGVALLGACGGASPPPAPPPAQAATSASNATSTKPASTKPAPTTPKAASASYDPSRVGDAQRRLRECNLRVGTRGKILANQKALRASIKGDVIAIDEKIILGGHGVDPVVPDSFADVGVLLHQHPEIQAVEIAAHVDKATTGTDRETEAYSQKWALEVAHHLQQESYIPGYKIRAVGYGSHCPIDPASTPEAKEKNRRIEMRIIQRDGKVVGPGWGGCDAALAKGMKKPADPPPPAAAKRPLQEAHATYRLDSACLARFGTVEGAKELPKQAPIRLLQPGYELPEQYWHGRVIRDLRDDACASTRDDAALSDRISRFDAMTAAAGNIYAVAMGTKDGTDVQRRALQRAVNMLTWAGLERKKLGPNLKVSRACAADGLLGILYATMGMTSDARAAHEACFAESPPPVDKLGDAEWSQFRLAHAMLLWMDLQSAKDAPREKWEELEHWSKDLPCDSFAGASAIVAHARALDALKRPDEAHHEYGRAIMACSCREMGGEEFYTDLPTSLLDTFPADLKK